MRILRRLQQSQRGAMLIQVAVGGIAFAAVGALAFDYGVKWIGRTQAQRAADAGALAGAVSLMLDGTSATEAGPAKTSARKFANQNQVWSQVPSAKAFVMPPDANTTGAVCVDQSPCVRVDVYRNQESVTFAADQPANAALPTFLAKLVGVNSQGVKATATAQVKAGNFAHCLLPFAVIDRWADNWDPTPVTTYFPNDGLPGTAGWSPNDDYQPNKGDVYIGPYNGNTNTTGWQVSTDYGRQLVLKTGLGTYSNGWANLVYLPGSNGANELKDDIEGCNEQPVGISTASNPCTASDEAHGCLDIKTGTVQGPVRMGVQNLVGQDSGAVWNPTADGPNGPGKGAVVGGKGMSSPRIRPIVTVDIDHLIASGCTGGTCVVKAANIIGFFVEGMCNTVTLDSGMVCEDPSKMVVGRIVTVPGAYLSGGGNVESSASFLKVVMLVR